MASEVQLKGYEETGIKNVVAKRTGPIWFGTTGEPHPQCKIFQ